MNGPNTRLMRRCATCAMPEAHAPSVLGVTRARRNTFSTEGATAPRHRLPG